MSISSKLKIPEKKRLRFVANTSIIFKEMIERREVDESEETEEEKTFIKRGRKKECEGGLIGF